MKQVGFLWQARNPPTAAMSPSLKVAGSGPLYNTLISFLKSVKVNLCSSGPFFISMEPCLTTPLNLNLQPGNVLCITKKEGVIDCEDSCALLACKKLPTVSIIVEQKTSLKTMILFNTILFILRRNDLNKISQNQNETYAVLCRMSEYVEAVEKVLIGIAYLKEGLANWVDNLLNLIIYILINTMNKIKQL